MVPWLFSRELLGCLVAEDDSKLVVFLGYHFLPWAFLLVYSFNSKLSSNGSFLDTNIINRAWEFTGLFLLSWLLGQGITSIGSYLALKFPGSPINDRIVYSKKRHSQKHRIPSKIYNEEWVYIWLILIMDSEIGNLYNFPYAVLSSIYFADGSGVGEVLGWNRKVVNYFWRNEIFGCTTVN